MSDILVSRRYARALMQASMEQDCLESVKNDVDSLAQMVQESEDFRQFLEDPMIRPRFKQEIFTSLFEERLHPLTVNFLNLLAEKQREPQLVDCLADFQRVLDQAEGTVTAHVATVIPLSRSQKRNLSEKLEQFSGKKIRFEEVINPDIMGGLVVRIEDTVLDGSVTTQLTRLKEHLAKG